MSVLLFDALTGETSPPVYVTVDGGPYLILTDFRHWARVESTLLDTRVSEEHKTLLLLSSYMPARLAGQIPEGKAHPGSIEDAIEALQWFFACGDVEPAKDQKGAGGKRTERGYDFKHDIGLIYAAFRDAYGIDLMAVKDMHWWVFRALFDGLPEGAAIRGLMQVRTQRIEKPTPAQKSAREAVALPGHIRYFGGGSGRAASPEEWVARMKARKERG